MAAWPAAAAVNCSSDFYHLAQIVLQVCFWRCQGRCGLGLQSGGGCHRRRRASAPQRRQWWRQGQRQVAQHRGDVRRAPDGVAGRPVFVVCRQPSVIRQVSFQTRSNTLASQQLQFETYPTPSRSTSRGCAMPQRRCRSATCSHRLPAAQRHTAGLSLSGRFLPQIFAAMVCGAAGRPFRLVCQQRSNAYQVNLQLVICITISDAKVPT